MNQEGLNTQMVLVVHEREYGENAELATLFHAKSLALNRSSNFEGKNVSRFGKIARFRVPVRGNNQRLSSLPISSSNCSD